MATTLLALRSKIATALTGKIGTYTLGNSSTTPAVSVRDYGEGLATGTTVTGLEVVIVKQPDVVPVRMYKSENVQQEWTVYLVGWGAGVNMEAAAAAIVEAFPNSDVSTIEVPEGVGPRDQRRLTLRT